MQKRFAAAMAFFAICPVLVAQTAPTRIPRESNGKPNLTGLWQTLSTADWDIQDHASQPGPFYQLGAIGAEPPGQSIVEGDEIPYLPAALAQKKKNYENRYKD